MVAPERIERCGYRTLALPAAFFVFSPPCFFPIVEMCWVEVAGEDGESCRVCFERYGNESSCAKTSAVSIPTRKSTSTYTNLVMVVSAFNTVTYPTGNTNGSNKREKWSSLPGYRKTGFASELEL